MSITAITLPQCRYGAPLRPTCLVELRQSCTARLSYAIDVTRATEQKAAARYAIVELIHSLN